MVELLRPFASGGTSEVWEAKQTDVCGSRICLFKRLHAPYAQSPLFRAMFAREIYLSRLFGGHVTPWALAAGYTTKQPFYTMVRVRGLELRVLFQGLQASQHLFEPPHAVALATRLAQAVSKFHRGVLWDGQRVAVAHRDLSPDNIIFTDDGSVRILDLGTALPLLPAARQLRTFAVGKERYMAPAQRSGGVVDLHGDLFALGRLLEDIVGYCAETPCGLQTDMRKIIDKCTAGRFAPRWRSAQEVCVALLAMAERNGIGVDSSSASKHLRQQLSLTCNGDVYLTAGEFGTRRLDQVESRKSFTS